ncbi:hypothetical protein LTS10_004916 [Elasticomyces elasticus]|nr:hypothetical protein LTS10_004916 [Elasticomyces elasticus]
MSRSQGSLLDGGGSRWWDGEGTNGGKTKPKFFYAHKLLGKSSISNINIKNSPVQVFSINGADGLTLTNVHIDNTAGDSGGGHNTVGGPKQRNVVRADSYVSQDCFDVGSSNNVQIIGATCLNQDDCLAINSGTQITFSGGTCSGGHGISIGSVGGRDDNTVNGVVIENSKISNSQNGVRVKTISGATGLVKNVSYKGITLSGITKYGIVIEQDYLNGGPTGSPTSGVPITGLTISGVTGSVASSATDATVRISRLLLGTFILVILSQLRDLGVTGGKVSTACKGLPSGVTCSGK